MPSLPSSRNKHYLTGMDWVLRTFDYMNRRRTGAGNMFQIVMELEGVPPEDELRETLRRLMGKLPVLSGRTRRDYRLAPYWETPSRIRGAPPPLTVYHLEDGVDVSAILERAVNSVFPSARDHLSLHLIDSGKTSHVAVTFDHCLFDAHGAELFLGMFQREWEQKGACSWDLRLSEPAHLNQWGRKFEAGRQVNRAFLRLAENAPPRALPVRPASARRGFKFRVIPFSERQSRAIRERADAEAGYLMALPFTMAISVQVLHSIFVKRGIESGDYVIPVTIDTRSPKEAAEQIFFNHVSFFLFRLEAGEVEDFSALVESIKEQMYDQVKTGLARDLWEASFLMRIVPPPILSRLMRVHLKGEIASFCFSYVGEAGKYMTRFMGKRVLDSYHMTRVPVPPGLGVFFHETRGRLNAYLSYAHGLLDEGEATAIVESLRSRLEGNGADENHM